MSDITQWTAEDFAEFDARFDDPLDGIDAAVQLDTACADANESNWSNTAGPNVDHDGNTHH